MNNTIAEQLAGVQLSTIGNDDIKDNKAVLTERDLCSMVFENTPVKGSSIQTQKCRFSVNLRQMIDACPDISVSSNHNGILLQFPSAEDLKTVLLMKCSHYSNTVDKIRNLPQTFRFIKPHKGFIISCFTNRSLSTITSFLQDHGRIVYKSGERSCISFQEIKTAFDFMIKFRNLGPRISFESIEIISSPPWLKTPKADLPGSQSSAVSLNSPVRLQNLWNKQSRDLYSTIKYFKLITSKKSQFKSLRPISMWDSMSSNFFILFDISIFPRDHLFFALNCFEIMM